ncbi:MAG: DUF2268 domain-containing protein [Pseudomonadota bacterium]|nr:DUF2268 domain-containing protein [Pseudomonadota bacterium]
MTRKCTPVWRPVLALLIGVVAAALAPPAYAAPPHVTILTRDVDRFFAVYDRAHGKPTAQDLQTSYLDAGSDALHGFARDRKITGVTLQAAIEKNPAIYDGARRCAAVLPGIRRRLTTALARLAAVYPPARFPPVTIAIGRGNTGGTTNQAGVVMGLETLCAAPYLDPDVESRFVHLIAHEYAHIQQPAAQTDPVKPTVLFVSLVEGGAELVGEVISGDVGNYQFKRWTLGREREIETKFQAEMDGTTLDDWLWHGPGNAEHPGDLGYWVGYRIARSYFNHATDKCRALSDIIRMSDPHALLARSGWTPGMGAGPKPVLPASCPRQ